MFVGLGTLTSTQQQIYDAAVAQGINPALALAVAQQESAFNPAAKSSAGAIGLFQLMPATAKDLGVDPNDPSQNITGGVKYLSQMLSRCNGDVDCALWSYNAGPGNQSRGVFPAETQAYIPAVEGYASAWSGELGISDSSESSAPDESSAIGSMSPWLIGGIAAALVGLMALRS